MTEPFAIPRRHLDTPQILMIPWKSETQTRQHEHKLGGGGSSSTYGCGGVLVTKIGPLEKYKNTVRQDIFNHQFLKRKQKKKKEEEQQSYFSNSHFQTVQLSSMSDKKTTTSTAASSYVISSTIRYLPFWKSSVRASKSVKDMRWFSSTQVLVPGTTWCTCRERAPR